MALTDNLISYWSFDASDSTDDHGSNDGTDTNITYVDGKNGKCASNTSANGKIATGSWELPAAFSVSMWIKLDSYDTATAFSTYNGSGTGSGTAQGYAIISDGTEWGYSNFVVDIGWTDENTQLNTWYHAVWTNDGTTAKVYLNGTEVNSGTCAHATTTRVFNLMSRGDESTQRLDGYIDEVGVWGRVITTTEISELYNSGDGLFYPFTADATNNALFFGGGI